jgi:hypothetical protein
MSLPQNRGITGRNNFVKPNLSGKPCASKPANFPCRRRRFRERQLDLPERAKGEHFDGAHPALSTAFHRREVRNECHRASVP